VPYKILPPVVDSVKQVTELLEPSPWIVAFFGFAWRPFQMLQFTLSDPVLAHCQGHRTGRTSAEAGHKINPISSTRWQTLLPGQICSIAWLQLMEGGTNRAGFILEHAHECLSGGAFCKHIGVLCW
jgi:hypothetical protein